MNGMMLKMILIEHTSFWNAPKENLDLLLTDPMTIKKPETFVTLVFFMIKWLFAIGGFMFVTILVNEQLQSSQLEKRYVDFKIKQW